MPPPPAERPQGTPGQIPIKERSEEDPPVGVTDARARGSTLFTDSLLQLRAMHARVPAPSRSSGPRSTATSSAITGSSTASARGAWGRSSALNTCGSGGTSRLKFIAPLRHGDPTAASRFLQEMKVVGSLDHPHLVRATDARQDGSWLYLVMELLEGLDFKEVVQRLGPLPVAEACAAVRQATLGLDYAHGRGVIHRDLKPSNLMLVAGGVVKVLDLGLALLWEAAGEDRSDGLTATGEAMGTPDFMAPEQCLDASRVSPPADLYSLGCTLYQLLAGRPPFFDLKTNFEKMQAHRQAGLPPIGAHWPGLPAGLVELLGRLTAKEPGARPTSAALAEALRPLGDGADLAGLLARALSVPGSDRGVAPRVPATRPFADPIPDDLSSPEPAPRADPRALRMALIYKRGVAPDESLLLWLETWFAERGHQVFVDRRLRIGVDWAREIEHQVRHADVVIPLLSAASIQSEMLTWELQTPTTRPSAATAGRGCSRCAWAMKVRSPLRWPASSIGSSISSGTAPTTTSAWWMTSWRPAGGRSRSGRPGRSRSAGCRWTPIPTSGGRPTTSSIRPWPAATASC